MPLQRTCLLESRENISSCPLFCLPRILELPWQLLQKIMFSPQECIYIYVYMIYIWISFQLFLRITLFLKTGKASVFPSLLKKFRERGHYQFFGSQNTSLFWCRFASTCAMLIGSLGPPWRAGPGASLRWGDPWGFWAPKWSKWIQTTWALIYRSFSTMALSFPARTARSIARPSFVRPGGLR